MPDYLSLLSILGVERALLVQPSVYGTDNSAMTDAMQAIREAGVECRGVAVLDNSATDEQLDTLHRLGVRGLRFNLVDVADASSGLEIDDIRLLCERIARLSWHAEFLIHVDDYPDLDSLFAEFPVELVIGHIGYCRIGAAPDSAGFEAVLRLANDGNCSVKLTGPYRISAGDLPYAEAADFAHAVVDAAPDRTIWGTDWPHVMVSKAMPNDADLCDLFAHWVTDPALRQRILADNPTTLYGFDDG